MSKPDKKVCDLVMKGGITSGVVYPKAVRVLSEDYHFAQIGGTSAGAIAAVVTAAAEYGRDKGGFDKVAALSADLSENLMAKFQPSPCLKPLFGLTIAILTKPPMRPDPNKTPDNHPVPGFVKSLISKKNTVLARTDKLRIITMAILRHFPGPVFGGALIGLISGLLCLVNGNWFAGVLGGIGMGIVGIAVALFCAIKDQVMVRLPENDYGMCKGLTQHGCDKSALTDWLTDTIDQVAGLEAGEGPLTIAHLKERGITVKTVTTDIVSRRPYTLPIQNNEYAFSPDEFRKLFPARVVDQMIKNSAPTTKWGREDLYYFRSDHMPVVVLARLSLSFPGLISAVPLYKIDHTLSTKEKTGPVVRCLFSDGGLSSNFPVHFFDQMLPGVPTFGISLGDFDERRVEIQDDKVMDDSRVMLPTDATDGRQIRTYPLSGTGAFVMALFNSAKDWQDTLQSALPGYRERIVNIILTKDEGGLNLNMEKDTILRLGTLGEMAGTKLKGEFMYDEHRWRRYLVEQNAVEDLLIKFHDAYTAEKPYGSDHDYAGIAVDYDRQSFKEISAPRRKALNERSEWICELGKRVKDARTKRGIDTMAWEPEGPKSHSSLRNIADMD